MANGGKLTKAVFTYIATIVLSLSAALLAAGMTGGGMVRSAAVVVFFTAILVVVLRMTVIKSISGLVGDTKEAGSELLKTDEKLKKIAEYLDRANEQIKILNKGITEKSKEMELFVYRVSNDFIAPLKNIEGFLGDLKKRGKISDPKELERLKHLSEHVQFMLSLANDLLILAKSGNVEEEKEEIDLKSVVEGVRPLFAEQLKKGNIVLNYKGESCLLYLNKNRLFEIIENIVSNSVKFRRENVESFIEVGVSEGAKEFCTVYVKDNGMGIAKEHHSAIFNMFFSIKDTEIEGQGTGLGLAIIKKVIEGYGGKIWIESERSKGTTVFFTLPSATTK